jgi:hypothetical protein
MVRSFAEQPPLVNLLTHYAPIRKVLAKSVTRERIICESFVPNLFMIMSSLIINQRTLKLLI